jgi:superfamily II DNA or RNA helicase
LITGSTAEKKREKIKTQLNEVDQNAILFASYGCVATGLTFKNIDYCIFAQSFKSKVINFQSIGRGLLLAADKTEFLIYDLIDCLPTKRLENQGKSKAKLYKEYNYDYKILNK